MNYDEQQNHEGHLALYHSVKLSPECLKGIEEWDAVISREKFKAQQDRDFDRKHFSNGGITMKPALTKEPSALDKAHAAGFPQPTESFEQKAAREFPKNIQRASDSQKK